MKRYVAEPGSTLVRDAMQTADGWFTCRCGFVEIARAVTLAAGPVAAEVFRREWSAFAVIEVDHRLVEHAAALALERELRSLDSLHLAAALLLPGETLTLATWDRRLASAALAEGIDVFPGVLE